MTLKLTDQNNTPAIGGSSVDLTTSNIPGNSLPSIRSMIDDSRQKAGNSLYASQESIKNFIEYAEKNFLGRMNTNNLKEDPERSKIIHSVYTAYLSIKEGRFITNENLNKLSEQVEKLSELADYAEGKKQFSTEDIYLALERKEHGLAPGQQLYLGIDPSLDNIFQNMPEGHVSLTKEALIDELLKKQGMVEKIKEAMDKENSIEFDRFWQGKDETNAYLDGDMFLAPFKSDKTTINVTRGFGRHMHPIDKCMKHHNGIDFASNAGLSAGADILSSRQGKVVQAGFLSGYGNTVVVDHGIIDGKRFFTLYAHLNKISVKAGQEVTTQQKVGTMGSTGHSTGAHLHFEIRTTQSNGTYANAKGIDPEKFLEKGGLNLT